LLGVFAAVASFGLAGATITACSGSSSSTAGGVEAGVDGGRRSEGGGPIVEEDSAIAVEDAAVEPDAASDAAADAKAGPDAAGPGVVGSACVFNRDCQLALRCECDESTGCACKTGTRGTGQNGITSCTDGNDCTSAVCVEGPPGTGQFCSDECITSKDCGGQLPLCTSIASLGPICIRTPPK
jgi:hypothetical protein